MDEFESRIGLLLRDAVPEPAHEISPVTVARLGRRRRLAAIAAPVTAVVALLAVGVLIFALTPWRSSDHAGPAAPAPHTIVPHKTVQLGPLTLSYPATWHARETARLGDAGSGLVHSAGVGDDPVRILSSQPIVRVCSPSPDSATAEVCVESVRRLGSRSVFIGINTFHPDDPTVVEPLLDTKIAGRPAQITDRANVTVFCPGGTTSARDVTIALGGGDYLSLLGCLGSSPASAKAFDAFVDSAH
jgi:hypothetical protein